MFIFVSDGKRKFYSEESQNSKYFNNKTCKYSEETTDTEMESNPNHIRGLKIYLPSKIDPDRPLNVIGSLLESCQKCKQMHEFVEDFSSETFKYLFYIGGRLIAEGKSFNKKDAKRECAEKAMERLQESQRVIYKDEINHEKITEIDKGNLVKEAYMTAPKISDDNLGNKLLKKMGWDGSSGVGKHADGISEPVFVDGVENRAGFGHQFVDRSVRKSSVEGALLNFLRDPMETEIKFSPDLTKEDRALVHRLCQKYHLKHKSFGKNEDRYLVVSKQ
jgi:R3H domain./G-patch domain./Double-stranded RNA binding motif.